MKLFICFGSHGLLEKEKKNNFESFSDHEVFWSIVFCVEKD